MLLVFEFILLIVFGHLGTVTLNWRMRTFSSTHAAIECDQDGYQRIRVYTYPIRWTTTVKQMWLRINHPKHKKNRTLRSDIFHVFYGGVIGYLDWVLLLAAP